MLRAICGQLPAPTHADSLENTELCVLGASTHKVDESADVQCKAAEIKVERTGGPTDVLHARTDSALADDPLLNTEGRNLEHEAYMTPRERFDFIILFLVFGALVGA